MLSLLKVLLALHFTVAVPAGGHSVTLTWTPSATPNVVHFVQRGSLTGQENQVLNTTGISCTTKCTYVDSTVVGGTTYYYTVYAQDASGNKSTPSNEAKAAVPLNPPTNVILTNVH